IGVPGLIGLNDLRGRFAGHFRPFNPFIALYEFACAAGNLRNSERVTVPFHQVTVAPTLPAALEHWIERIALVGRTMKHLWVDNIAVERSGAGCWCNWSAWPGPWRAPTPAGASPPGSL